MHKVLLNIIFPNESGRCNLLTDRTQSCFQINIKDINVDILQDIKKDTR